MRARQNLYRLKDKSRQVGIIREGFTFQYVVVPDGRRQILSFSVPGDFLSTSMITKGRMNFSIQALTPVRLCVFDRDELDAVIGSDPEIHKVFARACMAEKESLEARIVDLGRRTAEERIVRFMLDFRARLGARGRGGDVVPFPMKQQHVADALGLTQVHVSRIIGRLRKAGLLNISGGQLEIYDLEALRDIADGHRS